MDNTSDGKTILIVSGGIEARTPPGAPRRWATRSSSPIAIRSARLPPYADSCIIADVYGAPETAAAAERYNRKVRKIDGVICVAADRRSPLRWLPNVSVFRRLASRQRTRLGQVADEGTLRRAGRAGAVVRGGRNPAGAATYRIETRQQPRDQASR